MGFLKILEELYLVLAVAALFFAVLTVWLLFASLKHRRRFKKQKRAATMLGDKCDQLMLQVETLQGEIEAIRAINAAQEIPPAVSQGSWDSEPGDAPLYLEQLLDPRIFETTLDGGAVEVRAVPISVEAVTEYDTAKDAVSYSVKYDPQKKDWVIRKAGQSRAVRRFPTKEEAVKVAKELARKHLT